MMINNLAKQWIEAKSREKQATDERREIEDRIIEELNLSEDLTETKTITNDQFKIQAVGRINTSIDDAKLKQLAFDHGLETEMNLLFRFKPEVNKKLWELTDDKITRVLAQAITEKPSRISFKILENGE